MKKSATLALLFAAALQHLWAFAAAVNVNVLVERPAAVRENQFRGVRDCGRSDTAFTIGGLLPLSTGGQRDHQAGALPAEEDELLSWQRARAILFAVDSINADKALLPGVTIGFDVRDTRGSDATALREAMDLSRGLLLDTAEPHRREEERCSTLAGIVVSPDLVASDSVVMLVLHGTVAAVTYGPVADEMFSTAHPTNMTASANAVVDTLARFQLYLVLAFYTPAAKKIHEQTAEIGKYNRLAREKGVEIQWVAVKFEDKSNASRASTYLESKFDAVLLLTSQEDAHTLLKLQEVSPHQFIVCVSGSLWPSWDSPERLAQTIASGIVAISPFAGTIEIPAFDRFVSSLDCDLKELCNPSAYKLASDASIPLVIDAVYSIAHALHHYLHDDTSGLKRGKDMLHSISLDKYLSSVQFTSITGQSGTRVDWSDVKGEDIQEKYTIVQHLPDESSVIGEWIGSAHGGGNLNLHGGLQHTAGKRQSVRCSTGFYLEQDNNRCLPCLGPLFSNKSNSHSCMNCSEINITAWGNAPSKGSDSCVSLDQVYLETANYVLFLVCLFLTIPSVFFYVMAVVFFAYYKYKTAREFFLVKLAVCGVLFLGMDGVFVAKPSHGVCAFRSSGAQWIVHSLFITALMIKLCVRINVPILIKRPAFIFKDMKDWHFWSLVMYSAVLVPQICLILFTLFFNKGGVPSVNYEFSFNSSNSSVPRLLLRCDVMDYGLSILNAAYTILVPVVVGFGTCACGYLVDYFRGKSELSRELLAFIAGVMVEIVFTFVLVAISLTQLASDVESLGFGDGLIALSLVLRTYTISVWITVPGVYYNFTGERHFVPHRPTRVSFSAVARVKEITPQVSETCEEGQQQTSSTSSEGSAAGAVEEPTTKTETTGAPSETIATPSTASSSSGSAADPLTSLAPAPGTQSIHSTPTHGSVLVKRATAPPSDAPPHSTAAVSQGPSSKQSTPSHASGDTAKQETDESLKEETRM